MKVATALRRHGYSRFEWLEFLVKNARDEGNSAEFRFQCFSELDRVCIAIASSHPKAAAMLGIEGIDFTDKAVKGRYVALGKRGRRSGSSNGDRLPEEDKDLGAPLSPFVALGGEDEECD